MDNKKLGVDMITAKWIWVDKESRPDTYGEFYDEFNWEEGEVNCLLSCDSDYTLFVNGQYVASNQYGDFEHYKVYDAISVLNIDIGIVNPFFMS